MAYMRIHCGDCGMVKEVHKYVPDDTEVRYCPLCGSEIDRDIWETMIIPAVELLNKANRAFIAKHTEENTTPIYIDVFLLYKGKPSGNRWAVFSCQNKEKRRLSVIGKPSFYVFRFLPLLCLTVFDNFHA